MKRTFQQVLALPKTADEERVANQHIARECERIQATWTPREERLRRVGWKPQRVVAPVVALNRGDGGESVAVAADRPWGCW